MQSTVVINGVDVSDALVDVQTHSYSTGSTIESTMEVLLSLDATRLAYVDLRGNVSLQVPHDGRMHTAFCGLITHTEVVHTDAGDACYLVKCKDFTRLFEEVKAGGGFGQGMLPPEIIYYLAAGITPDRADPSNFGVDDGKTLADLEWLFRKRRFVYIAPVPACSIDGQGVHEMKLAGAWLYTAHQPGSIDDRYIAGVIGDAEDEPREEAKSWRTGETRVRLFVQATNFLEALEKGRARLRNLLDVLSFGANYATPIYGTPSSPHFFAFDRDRTLVDVRETEWAYVRDTFGSDRYWLHWSAPHRHREPFTLRPQDPLLSLYEIFQELVEEDDERLSGKQRALLNALHSLRQVRQAEDAKDALDHVWRCMEFLMAGYSTEPLFSKDERRMLVTAAQTTLQEREGVEPKQLQAQMERVQSVLNNKLNDTALRTKWKMFCQEHSLTFPPADENFLWTLRNNRNDHQHGRGTAVTRNDTERAATIMEKVLVAAVVHYTQE